jgi:metallo-beta-lactamase family protein
MPGVTATFHDAGHILGSAMVELALTEGDIARTLFFTGDLGRKGMPIIRDPYQAGKADYLMTESTYGDRIHGSFQDTVARLEQLVRDVYQRRGKIIIPAFSVGRTQEIVYELHRMFNTGTLPPMPIFVDSPLSANATEVFRAHPECFDEETVQLFGKEDDPFGFRRLTYIGSSEDSKKLNHIKEPCVIISASGMCEGGRILHHLANSLGDRRNLVLIVGFQAEGTLGRKLVEKRPSVRIFGQEHQVQAQVEVLNGFSAHADRNEIIDWVRSLGAVRRAFLVHGEEKQCLQLEASLQQLGVPATVPVLGQAEELP